jgi:hypothetical protein
MVIVGAEGFGASPEKTAEKSQKLKRAEELEIRVLTEEEFCALADVPTPSMLKRQYHAMRDLLARYRAVREDHLRYLVKCGILRPVLRPTPTRSLRFPICRSFAKPTKGSNKGSRFAASCAR